MPAVYREMARQLHKAHRLTMVDEIKPITFKPMAARVKERHRDLPKVGIVLHGIMPTDPRRITIGPLLPSFFKNGGSIGVLSDPMPGKGAA